MNKFLITSMIATMISFYSMGAEKKALKSIDTDSLTSDTQISPKGTGDDHLAIVWWIPNEFWKSILSRDDTTSKHDKKAMLDAMSGISLLAVVQADISSFGSFKFYSKEKIEKKMTITFTGPDGKKHTLSPLHKISPDLQTVLGVFKPILGAAMGNLGKNMHFYVLNDKSSDSSRLADPYKKGLIKIQLKKNDKALMNANIELPLNSLFVPRKCPNGKDAHISWNFCPWTGKKLKK